MCPTLRSTSSDGSLTHTAIIHAAINHVIQERHTSAVQMYFTIVHRTWRMRVAEVLHGCTGVLPRDIETLVLQVEGALFRSHNTLHRLHIASAVRLLRQ